MDFTTFRYDIIEDSYVLVSVLKNMQLVAEIRFYPNGDRISQNDYNFVICSDDELAEEIFYRANQFAREHKLINEGV